MGKLYKRDRSPFWWASYVDHEGKRKRMSTGCRDKLNASKVLAKLETDSSMITHGVKSVMAERLNEPLADHLDAYLSTIESRNSDKYAKETRKQLEAINAHAGWNKLGDVNSTGLEGFVKELNGQGRSARTVGSYVGAMRSFCNWCVLNGRLAANPVVTVKKPGLRGNRRYKRRMLLPTEWKVLRKSMLELNADRNGQSANERLLMYQTAIETGLRSGELRSMSKHSLKLDAEEPYVVVDDGDTKNRRMAKQFISDGLTTSLQKHVRRKTMKDSVFTVMVAERMAEKLREDIEAARLDYKNPEGEILDFHALRHTCGAWLVIEKVTLPEVQSVMRHSTITLTIDAYGHLAPDAASRNRQILGKLLSEDE